MKYENRKSTLKTRYFISFAGPIVFVRKKQKKGKYVLLFVSEPVKLIYQRLTEKRHHAYLSNYGSEGEIFLKTGKLFSPPGPISKKMIISLESESDQSLDMTRLRKKKLIPGTFGLTEKVFLYRAF